MINIAYCLLKEAHKISFSQNQISAIFSIALCFITTLVKFLNPCDFPESYDTFLSGAGYQVTLDILAENIVLVLQFRDELEFQVVRRHLKQFRDVFQSLSCSLWVGKMVYQTGEISFCSFVTNQTL